MHASSEKIQRTIWDSCSQSPKREFQDVPVGRPGSGSLRSVLVGTRLIDFVGRARLWLCCLLASEKSAEGVCDLDLDLDLALSLPPLCRPESETINCGTLFIDLWPL